MVGGQAEVVRHNAMVNEHAPQTSFFAGDHGDIRIKYHHQMLYFSERDYHIKPIKDTKLKVANAAAGNTGTGLAEESMHGTIDAHNRAAPATAIKVISPRPMAPALGVCSWTWFSIVSFLLSN